MLRIVQGLPAGLPANQSETHQRLCRSCSIWEGVLAIGPTTDNVGVRGFDIEDLRPPALRQLMEQTAKAVVGAE